MCCEWDLMIKMGMEFLTKPRNGIIIGGTKPMKTMGNGRRNAEAQLRNELLTPQAQIRQHKFGTAFITAVESIFRSRI